MDDLESSTRQATSHKGEKRTSYSMDFKKQVIKFAEENSNRSAGIKFKIEVKRVREWRQNKDKIVAAKDKRQRLDGGGRKVTDQQLEEELLKWIFERRNNMLRVSRKLIMFKAKSRFDEMCGENEPLKDSFVASRGWLQKFMKRNHLSCRYIILFYNQFLCFCPV